VQVSENEKAPKGTDMVCKHDRGMQSLQQLCGNCVVATYRLHDDEDADYFRELTTLVHQLLDSGFEDENGVKWSAMVIEMVIDGHGGYRLGATSGSFGKYDLICDYADMLLEQMECDGEGDVEIRIINQS
jgi:hypothetical protein